MAHDLLFHKANGKTTMGRNQANKIEGKKGRSKMKTVTALLISIGIILSANHSAKALTFEFDTLAPVITARADFDHLLSGVDAIFANLDDRVDCVRIMQGHWGKNDRFFHMLGYRATDLVREMAILTPPRGLTAELIAPVGFDTASMGLHGPRHELPGLNFHHPNTHDNPVPTPEPATLLLLGSGMLGLCWSARRMKKVRRFQVNEYTQVEDKRVAS